MKQQDFAQPDMGGFFNSLFEHAAINAMMLMTTGGQVLTVNRAFTALFGYHVNDIAGKHFSLLFTVEDREAGKPEREIESVAHTGSGKDRNYIVHKNGHKIWASGETILVKDSSGKSFMVKVIQDLHEQKTLENFLTESNELLQNILMTISDALMLVSTDLRVLKINGAFAELFETSAEDYENNYIPDTPHAFWTSPEIQQLIEETTRGNKDIFRQTFMVHRSNGKKRIVSISTKQVNSLSGPMLLFIIQDVTEARINEKRKKDMTGFISHELRNPLTKLNLAIKMIKDQEEIHSLPEVRKYIKIVDDISAEMNNLISELHESTKASYKKIPIEKSHFPFDGIIHSAIQSALLSWPQLTIEKQGSVGKMVYADKYKLEQVLNNFIGNAVKYAGTDKPIQIFVEEVNNHVTATVKDQGPGIKKENIKFLFRRLYRTPGNKAEGLGLGLYMARQIVKAHQGKVWAESREGDGAAFSFSIPLLKELK